MARVCLILAAIATLSLTFAAVAVAAPANDDFANAEVLSGTSDSASGTNVEATKEEGEPDHAGHSGGASVWYQWEAPESGTAVIDTCASDFDTLLGVYTGSAVGALGEVTSNDDDEGSTCSEAGNSYGSRVTFEAHAGTTYRIAVDGYGGATGAVGLSLELEPGPPPPANDDFANAEVLSGTSGSASGTNVAASKQSGEPNHAGNPGGASVWYEWEAPEDGVAFIDTCASDFDTLLGVYTGSAVSALGEVTSNDDGCGGQSSVSFYAHAGTIYRIAVDGYDGATGAVELWLELEEPLPVEPPVEPPSSTPPAASTSTPAATTGSTAAGKKASSASAKCRKAKKRVNKAKKRVKKAKKRLKTAKGSGNEAKLKKAKRGLKRAKRGLKRANRAKRKVCPKGKGTSPPTSSPGTTPVNHPPYFLPRSLTYTYVHYVYSAGFLVGAEVHLTVAEAIDPDGDPLTYTWAATTGKVYPSSENPRIATWHVGASAGQVSCGTASVTASDGKGGADTAYFETTGC
jgi:Bacterial Ig domain